MALVDRVRNICVSPATEWAVIEQERAEPAELTVSYLAPLAAIGAVAGFIGVTALRSVLPFMGSGITGFVAGLVGACVAFVMTIVGCFVIAFIINALAPSFGATANFNQAFKTSVYSYTPGLVAGVLQIVPLLGGFIAVIAGLYGLYLLYVGLPLTMKAPREKAAAYNVVVVIASIVRMIVVSVIMGFFGVLGVMGSRLI